MTIKTIYFDMDGVLVDFEEGFNRMAFDLTDIPMDEVNGDPVSEWLTDNAVLISFFKDLKPMEDFLKLKSLIQSLSYHYNVKILTSCGDYAHDVVKDDKSYWLKKHGLGHLPLLTTTKSAKKAVYASNECVLIDDRVESVDPFMEAGGNAILYTSYDKLIEDLREHTILSVE